MRKYHQQKLSQSGFVLVMVMVVLLILGIVSSAALERANENIFIGTARQKAELAQILANTAQDMLVERFISANYAVADIDGDGTPDLQEGYADLSAAPSALPLSYAFWLVGQAKPIVQLVVNGEAANAGSTLTTQKIASSVTALKADGLFLSGTIKPLLIKQSATGVAFSTATKWSLETSKNKAAVWLEYEKNATNSAWTDVYCGAISQVSDAKGYTRKYIGTYTDNLGGMLLPKRD